MLLRIDQFRGLSPKTAPALLPPYGAQIASQARLSTGSLVPINAPKRVSAQTAVGATAMYMLGASGSQLPLTWTTDVDVAPSPVTDDEYKIYYTDGVTARKTNYSLATGPGVMPLNSYLMGTPAPTATPAVAATTGSVPAGSYAYIYTCVTQFGATLLEESAPSPAGTITLASAGGVTITNLLSPAATGRNYVYKRIYRTTGATYQMVAQIAFASVTYTDILSATQIAGDALITAGWRPPLDDLKGICTLPGQTMAAFRGNEIWFSEPGYPHAWPFKYMQTVDAQIVGIKPFGNSLVVATVGYPHLGSGQHPESFTFRKLPLLEPCVSKRSLAATSDGVFYASRNGLISVGEAGYGVASSEFVSRESFTQFNPSSFKSCVFEGRYYGFYDLEGVPTGALVFARSETTPVSTIGIKARAVFTDMYTARLLFLSSVDDSVYEYDPLDTVPYSYEWKSKLFQFPVATSLGVVRLTTSKANTFSTLFASQEAADIAANTAANTILLGANTVFSEVNVVEVNAFEVNGSALNPAPTSVPITVLLTIWADGEVVFYKGVLLNQVYRIPAGFLATGWEVAVSGQREVFSVELATSAFELSGA